MIWQKKLLFSIFLMISVYIIIEIFSFGLYFLTTKQVFSWSRTVSIANQISRSDIDTSPDAPVGDSPDAPEIEILHPYLGYVFNPEPNSKRFINYYKYPVSQYGFLDDGSPFYVKTNNKLIIGIFGGSVAYWFSVYGTNALISELNKFPSFTDKEIVIVRVALPGYKQPQQLLSLNYLLALGAEFDIIINIDGFNEVALPPADNVPKNVFPFYPRNWFMRVQNLNDLGMLSIIGKIANLRSERIKWANFFSNSIVHYSVTASFLWRAYDQYLSSKLAKTDIELQEYRTNRQSMSYVATGVSKHYLNDDELYTDLTRVWKNCSLQMHRLSTTNDIKYFHFLQPNQYVPGSKIMKEEELKKAFFYKYPYKPGVEKGYPLLKTFSKELSQNKVNFRDLSMVFADNSEILYIDQCCHFNQRGNELLGKIIAKHIVDNFNSDK